MTASTHNSCQTVSGTWSKMSDDQPHRLKRATDMTVIDWLLDSDPAIRWQVMRDLTDAPADEVAAERAKVATEGWGAQILALQPAERGVGRRRLLPRVVIDDHRAPAAASVRPRPHEPGGTRRGGARPRQRQMGVRRPAVLRRRGRAVHQRPGGRHRGVLRRGRPRHRRSAADRPDGRRWLELRAGARLDPRIVRVHDQRARGPARVRASRPGRTPT